MTMEENERKDQRDDVFSRYVRAGKRTYFFDVKATRAQDYYLTITESTKKIDENGSYFYKKHRIFLYKEDFDKFSDRLSEVMEFIFKEKGATPIRSNNQDKTSQKVNAVDAAVEGTKIEGASTSESVKEESSNSEDSQIVEDAHEEAIANEGGAKKTENSVEQIEKDLKNE